MSDLDWCKKHNIVYLVPEIVDCPICWLEHLKKEKGKFENTVFYDEQMVDEIIRLIKVGYKTNKQES